MLSQATANSTSGTPTSLQIQENYKKNHLMQEVPTAQTRDYVDQYGTVLNITPLMQHVIHHRNDAAKLLLATLSPTEINTHGMKRD